jgi:hypothetical protein
MDFSNTDLKELACLIYETLRDSGINAVLVGGACVSIYSHNRYQSSDLDFATYEEMKPIEKSLAKLGFRRIGRQFSHEQCPYLIDFVNPPISVGHEAIHKFSTVNTSAGSLQLLSPTDCVKDRLASFFHWGDAQGLEQALLVAENHLIDLADIKRWAKKEGFEQKLDEFLRRYRKILNQ